MSTSSDGDGRKKLPKRLRRLQEIRPRDEDGNIVFFVTICVLHRHRVLANEAFFSGLCSFLHESDRRYGWQPTRFVVMPDHLHHIVYAGEPTCELGDWAKALKRTAHRLGNHVGIPVKKSWQWQESEHDHVFRSVKSEGDKWVYMCFNPVRAGLVEFPEQWEYGGEIFYDTDPPTLVRGVPAVR